MWYICLRRALRTPPNFSTPLDVHLAWMRVQHEAGRILMSGPSLSRKLGIYVIKAATEDEAVAVASSDPFTAAGDTTFELIDWDVRQVLGAGPFCTQAIRDQTRDASPAPKAADLD